MRDIIPTFQNTFW